MTDSMQLCRITGILRDHHGRPLPATALKIISKQVRSAGGALRAPRLTEVVSDVEGAVAFDLLPGPYVCQLQRDRTWDDFEIFVSDDVTQVEFQDLLAQKPVLTPPLVAEARQYRDEAKQYRDDASDAVRPTIEAVSAEEEFIASAADIVVLDQDGTLVKFRIGASVWVPPSTPSPEPSDPHLTAVFASGVIVVTEPSTVSTPQVSFGDHTITLEE